MENAPEQPNPVLPPAPPLSPKYSKFFITALIVLVLLCCVGAAFAVWRFSPVATAPSNSSQSSSTYATSTNEQKQVYASDYKLFIPPLAQDISNGNAVDYKSITYQSDGDVQSGEYAGYHIVVAVKAQNISDSTSTTEYNDYDFFVTKDFKTFLVATDFYNFPYYASQNFDKTKVTGEASGIPINFPQSIPIGNFVLVRIGPDPTTPNTSELQSFTQGLKFFSGSVWYGSDSFSVPISYVQGDTGIQVEDAHGIPFNYALVSQEAYARALVSGNATSSTSGNNFIAYNEFSNSYFENQDFTSGFSSYNSYDYLLPTHCGEPLSVGSILTNISDADLTPLGTTVNGLQLYTLKNPTHPLNQAEYDAKITSNGRLSSSAKPSYSQYISKNPILIFKDPWGRWVGVGEYRYGEPLGCGKPVIYLYPQKPTVVSVKFVNPISFTTDIPTYANGWKVLAEPSGVLNDLQPQDTNCSKIDSNVFGSEYAADACKKGQYPYLFWAGQTVGAYPATTQGWVVSKDGLSALLSQKLTDAGLSENEKTDMMSYWVPKMLKKGAPYYRVSLIQTAAMNNFIPMNVTPKPDTVIRVFLDWSPLSAPIAIQPEALVHPDRSGFTLVEWGGLNQ